MKFKCASGHIFSSVFKRISQIQWTYLDPSTEKVSKYEVYSGPYFPLFGLNTERYFVCLRIQFECGGKYGPENLRIWTLFTQ